jgi:O-acetylhomoserine/O-acetylserine sulfhydrylase-like pyridoxal-dependent enzyme
VRDVISKENSIKFNQNLQVEQNFDIAEVMYSRKMNEMNNILEERLNDIENQFLNDE